MSKAKLSRRTGIHELASNLINDMKPAMLRFLALSVAFLGLVVSCLDKHSRLVLEWEGGPQLETVSFSLGGKKMGEGRAGLLAVMEELRKLPVGSNVYLIYPPDVASFYEQKHHFFNGLPLTTDQPEYDSWNDVSIDRKLMFFERPVESGPRKPSP